jgi:hypothetical protein
MPEPLQSLHDRLSPINSPTSPKLRLFRHFNFGNSTFVRISAWRKKLHEFAAKMRVNGAANSAGWLLDKATV